MEYKENVVFYTVMMFDFSNPNGSINGFVGNSVEKGLKHIKMCDLLCMSLKYFGYKHRIITNDVGYFSCNSNNSKHYDAIMHLSLNKQLNSDFSFYLAMHKLDAGRLIESEIEYSILIDNDCIMLKDLPVNFFNAVKSGMPSIYQITDQVLPAYGLKSVMSDVTVLNPSSNLGLWFGGEIFGGYSYHFKLLSDFYSLSIENFNSNCLKLTQCNDENILSNFIQSKMINGVSFFDLGQSKIFSRFWSCKTLHFPNHWMSIKDSSILHLPGDKEFLSSYLAQNKHFDPVYFISMYQVYLSNIGYQIEIDYLKPIKKKYINRFFLSVKLSLQNIIVFFK